MSQLAASEGQPGNWEEPDLFLRRLETVRFQENGWQERYDGRLSRTVLRGPGGEIPPGYSTLWWMALGFLQTSLLVDTSNYLSYTIIHSF